MNDIDLAMKLVRGAIELAPYPSFIKTTALSTAEQQLRADPARAASLVRLSRAALYPCGHTANGCPTCPATDRLAAEATPAVDPKEVGERVADRLRNLK